MGWMFVCAWYACVEVDWMGEGCKYAVTMCIDVHWVSGFVNCMVG